jgi:hypothetical protein
MKKSQRSLHEARQKAESYRANVSPQEIRQLSQSKDPRERLLSLVLMRRQIDKGDPPSVYLPLAQEMVREPDGNCRWQAAIVVGESLETDADAVWQVVREHGDAEDADLRMAIATILLEHLFESDFDRYFSLLQDEVAKGRLRFLDTLRSCWLFGPAAQDHKKRIDNYLRKAVRGRPNQADLPG